MLAQQKIVVFVGGDGENANTGGGQNCGQASEDSDGF